jgi:8-oxo-dGTP pyrophosphatase MutT (NUDIX family)
MQVASGNLDEAFTAAGFRRLAKRKLHAAPSSAIFDPRSGRAFEPGDWDLNPDLKAELIALGPPCPAAVLVPLIARTELTVLLTQRAHDVPSHPGQISFPGGKRDAADASLADTALREAREEIGLRSELVEPLGFLDCYRTGTGFQVSPLVALVDPSFEPVIDTREVVETFEVPLRFLMNEANHQRHTREWRGRTRWFYAMPYGERYIWGATAGMIKNMHERLFVQ